MLELNINNLLGKVDQELNKLEKYTEKDNIIAK